MRILFNLGYVFFLKSIPDKDEAMSAAVGLVGSPVGGCLSGVCPPAVEVGVAPPPPADVLIGGCPALEVIGLAQEEEVMVLVSEELLGGREDGVAEPGGLLLGVEAGL